MNLDIGAAIAPFETTTGNLSQKWKRWLRSFKYYTEGKGIEDAKQKKSLLLHCAGPEVQDIFETLTVEAEGCPYGNAEKALNAYFAPHTNLVYEKHIFRRMEQKADETIDQFVMRLRSQAVNCSFADQDGEILGQIIDKCQSTALRRRLIEKPCTLKEAMDKARSMESAEKQAVEIENKIEEKQQVNKIEKKVITCYRCGRKGHWSTDKKCPGRNMTCEKCGLKGHATERCRTKNVAGKEKNTNTNKCRKKAYNVEEKSDDESEYAFTICEISNKNANLGEVMVDVQLGGVNIQMMIDSGSNCNVVDKDTWSDLKKKRIRCTSSKCDKQSIGVYGEFSVTILGRFETDIKLKSGRSLQKIEVNVIEKKGTPILGRNAAIQLGVLKVGENIHAISQEQMHITEQFPNIFSNKIGKLKNFQVRIPVNENVTPVVQPLRRIPFNVRESFEKELERLLNEDIIEKVEGPTPWVSPVVIVQKKSKEIRLCVDMRKANLAVIRERYQLPTFEELTLELGGAKWFSKIDIKMAYHQIELEEKSREITTFSSHKGLYRYKRLIFGISCAPEMFQRIIHQVYAGCTGILTFMDDIVVYGASVEEHDKRLAQFFTRTEEVGFTLNKEKCEFKKTRIKFLGHELSEKGVIPCKTNLQVIQEFRRPTSASEVRSFLGLVNFCGKFINNLATLNSPLRELTKSNQEFKWGREQEKAFQKLKESLTNCEVLGFFKKTAKTQIMTDASPVGLGAVLIQIQEGTPRIIAYGSRSLTDVEKKYSQTEKEALSIIWGFERFKMYLIGKEFELITDHKPLEFIFSERSKPSARIERWILRLQPFTYKVIYRKGTENIADPLSRLLVVEDIKQEDFVKWIAEKATPKSITTREIEEASERDPILTEVRESLKKGNFNEISKDFKAIKDELCTVGKLVLRGTRIVIPKELTNRILTLGHRGHLGTTLMKRHLRTKVWWPKMDREVEEFCRKCYECQLVAAPEPPEPMVRTRLPERPWQHIAVDFMGPLPNGQNLFVMVDYYSRFTEVIFMRQITTGKMLNEMKKIFSRYGYPECIHSDNGPQFTSEEYKNYIEINGMFSYKVTPIWPQANGEVERQNRSILKRMKIATTNGQDLEEAIQEFLLAYHTTPHSTTGRTPASLFFGRELKNKLPGLTAEAPIDEEVRDTDSLRKLKGKEYGDMTRRAREKEIEVGDLVVMEQERENKLSTTFGPEKCEVIKKTGSDITVRTPTGKTVRRNAKVIKKFIENEDTSDNVLKDTIVQEQEKVVSPRPVREKKTPEYLKDYVTE